MDAPAQTVTVGRLFKEGSERLRLSALAGDTPDALARPIPEPLPHRSGLALTGFFDHFANRRLQVIGLAEYAYLQSLDPAVRERRLAEFFAQDIPCVVYSRGQAPFPESLELARKAGVAVFQTELETRFFIRAATFVLEDLTAPVCALHGTMMDVSGVGVFMEGAAGVGKSETALGLIKHGHALVADDYTVFKRNGEGRLIASAKEITKNYMEIRGIGIIYIPWIFGVATVQDSKPLDLVITFVRANDGTELDRTGLERSEREILGVHVPQQVIPVAPGRDLVNLVETAAQAHKLRLSGYTAAEDLEGRIRRARTTDKGGNDGR